ncbi:SET and MYND domain-containing protein DDB_G0284059-like isoform X1 [Diabrotica virgifera virgifera]|uniref:MYND-type domain-containing protein n=1 Tax=Diabrotica virgifera virgifera TaxID=50390 RepID=A0ABM5KMD9_DIAVI|nr:SET and MYND domain-containing protein DDB_G0284059-like isoform X1 [Diabrotica virgifera virgifera]
MAEFEDMAYRTKCSERTLQTEVKGFFMDFVELVKDRAGKTWIQNTFGKLKTDSERIRSIYTSDETKDAVVSILSNVQEIYRKKDATVSQLKRLEAENVLEKGEMSKSLMLYSQSVLRAPRTGQCNSFDSGLSLSLALWGRSKVLMIMKEYSLALNDIQQAVKEHLPNVFKAEAYWKMAVCYKALNEGQKAKVAFELAEKLMDSEKKKEQLQQDKETEFSSSNKGRKKDNSSNTISHCVSNKLTVKSDKELGRFVVANKEIQTGETLVVESPYAACLLPGMFGTHCHHCFNRLQAPIGCSDCSNVAFCKPACRDAALSSYHSYECKYLDLLIGSGMSILAHTALRMVTQQKLEKCLEIYKNKSEEKIFNLCTNSDKRDSEDFFQRTLMAAFLLRCLQKCGYFGAQNDSELPTEDEFKIGEFLLFSLQMLQFNAHEIFEQVTVQDYSIKGSKLSYIGIGIYPTVAFFNHDCYPAVTRYFVGKDVVVKAVRLLQTNDIVAENYGPIFHRKPLKDRQKILSSRYWFKCKCEACIHNWPTKDEMENIQQRVRCPTTNCPNVFTLPVSNSLTSCTKCKENINLDENIRLLNWCEEECQKGLEFLDNNKPDKVVEVLCGALDIFHRVSIPPHKSTQLAQEILQLCMASFGNVSNTLKKK